MAKDYPEIVKNISKNLGGFAKLSPASMTAFQAFSQAGKDADALDKKTKELIALAIGITQRCDGCIGFHVKEAKALGATKEEIASVLSVCAYMGGGPALMYAADALEAYDQF